MALPFAILALCSLPIFSSADNLPLILLYTLLPLYMIHQYEEHAHGEFVEFFNATVGKEYRVLTKVSALWINVLEVWVAFLVTFYLARYVVIGLLAAIIGHAIIVVYALRRRGRLEATDLRGAGANP
jgi:hypothetical protein